jgi:quinoprotein glucose dehydrogenase
MPPGDVRGFDVRAGKQLWIFHAIPRLGEMSADEALGYVYLPFSTPSDDHYGVHRPGDGLLGESLVCLDARTGKRVWHFSNGPPRAVGLRPSLRAQPD